ncbi:hypothetical protein AB0H76_12415 [Nocardia sp. NPDC050712]|uniref:hypothetical protein n=1 Tax=Nocardia sp. NPDC050712 TaxID=3155518 RepID=UPI0033D528F4
MVDHGPIVARGYEGWSMKFARMQPAALAPILAESTATETINPLADTRTAQQVLAAVQA